jgi:hypothetical protein
MEVICGQVQHEFSMFPVCISNLTIMDYYAAPHPPHHKGRLI